jgi:hypothetical protein
MGTALLLTETRETMLSVITSKNGSFSEKKSSSRLALKRVQR